MANAISVMPWQLYRKSKPVYNELNDLITARPNPNMTSHQFFKAMEVCRCATGNAYAMKVYDAQGVLSRLDVLDPTKVTPVMDEDSLELWYRITLDSGKQAYFHNFYIIHVPFLTTNGYTGINPVCVLFDTLRYAEDIQKFNRDQLDDGVNTSIVLEAPANLSNEQRKQVVKDLRYLPTEKLEAYGDPNGFVEFPETYDVAQIYADGKLVADQYDCGFPWRIPASLLNGKECYLVMSPRYDRVYRED